MKNIRPNPETSFNPDSAEPRIYPTAYIHPLAAVIGDVEIGAEVMVAPGASIRADEGTPFFIGKRANVQDGVVIHALETNGNGKNTFDVGGRNYSVYVGERVSLAHQCQIHGPAVVEEDSFVGMQAFIFKSRIGRGSVVEPGAKVMGVTVGQAKYVPAGRVIREQREADDLPAIDENYPLRALNAEVVKVNVELARAYNSD